MNLEQSWQSVLGQLKTEMPRASFDTWVRDTTPLSFERGVLTIGVRNAYARDWLESRLANTISRVLNGIMDAEVTVNFVVPPEDDFDEEQAAETIDGFTAEIADATRYAEEVQPDRIVLIPGYSLRLLEQGDLTPKEMSLWVGFRQAVYSQWKKGQGTVKNIPHWEVIRFSLMSRASYFRELSGKDALAGRLVEVIPEPASISQGSRSRDNANRYRVHMAPRLTRRDCAVIEVILTAEASMAATREEGQRVVLETLTDLAGRDPVEYLDQDVEVGKVWPRNILDIVRRVLGIEDDIPDELANAAERLFDRIIRAYGQVLITHYFLREVVPVLSLNHAQTWAIIMLRDRCWYDYETSTQKEFVVIPEGLDTLARWVGVSRKSVDRWMVQPEFSAFVHRVDLDKVSALPGEWRTNGKEIFLVSQQEPLLSEALEGIETQIDETKRDSILDKVRLLSGQSETQFRTKRDSILDKMRLDLGQSETRLNNLIKPLLNPYKPQESPPTRAQKPRRMGVGSMAFWDLGFLMENNAVHPGSVKNLLKINRFKQDVSKLARGFVSWLLYAYSPAGSGVSDPAGLAIKRLQDNVHAGAGADFDRLASLRPHALKALFDADLAGDDLDDSLEADIYAVNFAKLLESYKRQLYRRLFGGFG